MRINYLVLIAGLSITCSACAMKPTESKLCAFCSCCLTDVEKIIEFGDKIISIVELVDPSLTEKGIFSAIVKVADASKTALLELAAACKAESVKISAESLPILQKSGLVDISGQVSAQVKDVVNAAVKVAPK